MPNTNHRLEFDMKIKYIFAIIAGSVCVCNAHAEKHCVVRSCNSGYYVNGSIHESSTGKTYYTLCSQCPGLTKSDGTIQYGTTPAGLSTLSDCTIPAGKYKDATGTYEYTSACKY